MDPDREIGFVEKQRSSKAQNGRVQQCLQISDQLINELTQNFSCTASTVASYGKSGRLRHRQRYGRRRGGRDENR